MKKTLLASLTALSIVSSPILNADEIKDQMNEAIKAYEDKDYKGAINELKFITAQLHKLDAAENQKLLPDPLDGWKMQTTDNGGQAMMSAMGGGTSMEATYTQEEKSITIRILANSPMIAMMSMSISNPALIAADPSSTPYRYKRIKGIKKKEESSTTITLLIAGQILIELDGDNITDDSLFEKYLDRIEIQKLKMELL